MSRITSVPWKLASQYTRVSMWQWAFQSQLKGQRLTLPARRGVLWAQGSLGRDGKEPPALALPSSARGPQRLGNVPRQPALDGPPSIPMPSATRKRYQGAQGFILLSRVAWGRFAAISKAGEISIEV